MRGERPLSAHQRLKVRPPLGLGHYPTSPPPIHPFLVFERAFRAVLDAGVHPLFWPEHLSSPCPPSAPCAPPGESGMLAL